MSSCFLPLRSLLLSPVESAVMHSRSRRFLMWWSLADPAPRKSMDRTWRKIVQPESTEHQLKNKT